MIAKVVFTAILLFKIVASMYSPFSVNTLGIALLFEEKFADEIFDRKNFSLCRIELKHICFWKFFRIISDGLVYSLGLYTIQASDISIYDNILFPNYDDFTFHIS